MTVAADVAALRFELETAEPTTLNSLKYTVNNKLEAGVATLAKEGANVANGTFSSFTLENIAEAHGTLSVYADVAHLIHTGMDKGASDEEIIATVKKVALQRAIMEWKPNSTSNMSVELDLNVKAAWGRFYSDFS